MGDSWDGIPADVFVDILQRIPLTPRRRLRLVCRHWRDVIDERIPNAPRTHPKVLAFLHQDAHRCRAYVFDNLPGGEHEDGAELDLDSGDVDPTGVSVIGTCNGLLCLWRSKTSDIAVTNPATGEAVLAGTPVTRFNTHERGRTYCFGYHEPTGRYKILHLPAHDGRAGEELRAVHVLTLREGGSPEGWREVAAPPGSGCCLQFGLVAVGGAAYWVAGDAADRLMSFDLGSSERVAFVDRAPRIPVPLLELSSPGRVTEVRGRLALAVLRHPDGYGRNVTEVWVLEEEEDDRRHQRRTMMTWVKRYAVLSHGAGPRQRIALPHVVHGEHVLTTCHSKEPWRGRRDWGQDLNANLPRAEKKIQPCLMLRVGAPRPETVVAKFYDGSSGIQTFAYVETTEPVRLYGFGIRYCSDEGRYL